MPRLPSVGANGQDKRDIFIIGEAPAPPVRPPGQPGQCLDEDDRRLLLLSRLLFSSRSFGRSRSFFSSRSFGRSRSLVSSRSFGLSPFFFSVRSLAFSRSLSLADVSFFFSLERDLESRERESRSRESFFRVALDRFPLLLLEELLEEEASLLLFSLLFSSFFSSSDSSW